MKPNFSFAVYFSQRHAHEKDELSTITTTFEFCLK